MSVLALVFLLAAGIVFLLRAFWVVETRVNLVSLGLALFVGYVLCLHFTTATVGH